MMNEQQRNKMAGLFVENQKLLNVLSASDGQWFVENPKEGMALFIEIIKNRNKTMSKVWETEYLSLIFGGDTPVIDQCDGKSIIADATDIFYYIDPNFRNLKADEIGQATPDTPVSVFEQTKDGVFTDIFDSITKDKDRLCLTQGQIIGFVKNLRDWLLIDSHATFFLFKSNGNYFVARASFDFRSQFIVRVYGIGDVSHWGAGRCHRFVVPQLTPQYL